MVDGIGGDVLTSGGQPTGIGGVSEQKKIHDILRDGKIHGVISIDDVSFGIVCDTIIDPERFAKAAQSFLNAFKDGGQVNE